MKSLNFITFLKTILILTCTSIFFFIASKATLAETKQVEKTNTEYYYTAQVLKVLQQGVHKAGNRKNPFQTLRLQFLDGPDTGKQITLTQGIDMPLQTANLVYPGDMVILAKTAAAADGKPQFIVYDKYRLNALMIITIVFLVFVLAIAGLRGLGSIFGIAISLAVILFYIAPQIISGQNPLLVSLLGSLVILLITTYLAHGISRQTTVAVLSTFVALMITVITANYFVNFSSLSGLNDETSQLVFGPSSIINLQGLLLAGVIIGTLGALNDITTSQSAAVFELARTDTKLKFQQLFSKGMSIGREHIVSMVNTLVLAYAGSSLILFLFIIINPAHIPFWVIINNELISDEIVRTTAGSIGLLFVVPIVTAIAAAVCDKKIKQIFKI